MLQCPECGLSRKLYNNESIDHMFLYVLENHLLHEYCPNPDCENYRVNVYENYPDPLLSRQRGRTDRSGKTEEIQIYRPL